MSNSLQKICHGIIDLWICIVNVNTFILFKGL